jgi:hypothetical protein
MRSQRSRVLAALATAAALGVAPAARADVTLRKDPFRLDLGATLHAGVLVRSVSDAAAGAPDPSVQPILRRARLRVAAWFADRIVFSLQTDRGTGESGTQLTFNIIDAYARFEAHPALHVTAGLHLPTGSRAATQASTSFLMIDRVTLGFKALSWGMRTLSAFNTDTIASTDTGLRTRVPVRDLGITVHGILSPSRSVHVKYAAGVYEGVPRAFSNAPHVATRVELDVGDAERGLIAQGSAHGARRIFGVGAFWAVQPDLVRTADRGDVPYHLLGADVFYDAPAGKGSLTLEGGVQALSMGGAERARVPASADFDLRTVEGLGAHAQVGYEFELGGEWFGAVQPWIGGELWRARSPAGDYAAGRVGANLFVWRRAVSVRVGYEALGLTSAAATSERLRHSFITGMYLSF